MVVVGCCSYHGYLFLPPLGGIYKTEDFLVSLEEVCGAEKMVDLNRGEKEEMW